MPRAIRADARLDTGLFVACLALGATARILPPPLRDPVAAAIRRTVVAPAVALQRAAERGRDALLTHDALVRARDSLALVVQRQAPTDAENGRLRRLLGLAADLAWGFVPADALQGRTPGDEFTITLTAGARQGVRPFSPVVAPDGLVGTVITTDPDLSIAILWAHPDFRVSAMAADGSAFGIVRPRRGPGTTRWMLELTGVPLRQPIALGTRLVSSGLGGTHPRGIPVGTVLEEVKAPESFARTYLVRPAVSPADLGSVMVLLPSRGAAGVADAWPAPTAEAVARAGAALRDSIRSAAREAAGSAAQDTSRPPVRDTSRPPVPDPGGA